MKLMELMGLIPVGASRSKQIPDPWRRPRLARYGATENSAHDPPRKKTSIPPIASSGSSGSKSCSRALKTGSKPSYPLGLPRCRSRGRKMGLLDIRIGQLMSIDILAREISITFLEPVTPQNPIDVTEGEISININRPREGRIGDFGRQNSPPGEEANNRNTQQSPWRPKRVPKRYRNPSKARLMKLMELMGLIPVAGHRGASKSRTRHSPIQRALARCRDDAGWPSRD